MENTKAFLLDLFNEAVNSVKPDRLFKENIDIDDNILCITDINKNIYRYDISKDNGIIVIGAGKASALMASATEKLLGNKILGGIIATKQGFGVELQNLKMIESGHPLPDDNSLLAGKEIIEAVESAGRGDLIIFLLSGGASALIELPENGIELEELIETNRVLLECGASIHEINSIRRAISKIKGGGMLRYFSPADAVSLIVSDVMGNNLESIGSGPTVPHPDNSCRASEVVRKYALENKLPAKALEKIYEADHTPVKQFGNVKNLIIGDNSTALTAVQTRAKAEGIKAINLGTTIKGEACIAAQNYIKKLKEIRAKYSDLPFCVISGGETTVTIRGQGKGGRNQEFALACAMYLTPDDNISILSGGTDGNDGPTDAAGAFADDTTIKRARKIGLNAHEFLERNDSYNFFYYLDDLIITGPTRTNVMDVQIALINT